jgi:hypothetical protein
MLEQVYRGRAHWSVFSKLPQIAHGAGTEVLHWRPWVLFDDGGCSGGSALDSSPPVMEGIM